MIALVTGGTGSLGRVLVPKLLELNNIERVRVLSRDEHKQIEMEESLKSSKIDFFVGDVRDKDRMLLATRDCNMVFHLAACKSVDKAEYNPNEAIETNINGTRNVVWACLQNDVEHAVFTSTDKACEPINIYGATKLVGEKLFIQSNSYRGRGRSKFHCVRYGNVLGSNGSVLAKWGRTNTLKITDPIMTRFFILQEDAADFIIKTLDHAQGGELFIPMMRSCSLVDLHKAYKMATGTVKEMKIVGPRPGEKIDEVLISNEEVPLCTQSDKGFFIRWPNKQDFEIEIRGNVLDKKFAGGYSSRNAEQFTTEELANMVKKVL